MLPIIIKVLGGNFCALENKSSFDGLLVKAQADAIGFFTSLGMKRLAVEDPARDYEHRFWKSADQINCEYKASSS